MSTEGKEYTIYFAWVPENTPWSLELARFDEYIFDMVLEHDEGQIPNVTIEIKNPRIGLISPTRLYWAWISYSFAGCDPKPLMFGRLVGIPEEMLDNTIKIKLIARDTDYIYQKQQAARSLKRLPNYDKVFFEVSKRDDPDAILEGWSARYHVSRIDGKVSVSDIILGEDGTFTFADEDVFYDNFKYEIKQVPLKAINIKVDVQWKQQYRGYINIGAWAWPTLGNDPFVGDWPKSGGQLGGGWSVGPAMAGERDPSIAQHILLTTKPVQNEISYTWHNQEKKHTTGDTMSISVSYTLPFGESILLKQRVVNGFIDEFALDENGDPAPINQPASSQADYFCYRKFALNFEGKQSIASLGVIYSADRQRSERLEMTLEADIQPVLIDPLVTEDTEDLVLKSGDLSLPIIDLNNWSSVGMGGAVAVGEFIFPDNPRVPGQTSSQICIRSGVTGMEEPIFSNIAGVSTLDGDPDAGVIWVSLGQTQPTEGTQDWVRLARVPLGTLLVPKLVSGVADMESTLAAGSLNYPPHGVPVAKYTIFSQGRDGPGASMAECIIAGMMGGISAGEQAQFHYFTNPAGLYMYIAVQAGTTGEFHTTFGNTVGSQTHDGSVIWQNIGLVELPIGGYPGMTPAAAYFSTDRGQQSVQHFLCRGRAKLRKRARAVEVRFDTRFEVAAQLSCRMNGRVSDKRLPGGSVWGKIIGYRIEAHGDTGVLKGSVVLGCSVGKNVGHDERDLTDPGLPCYVREGYVRRGYQRYYSTSTELTPGDPNYRAPGTAAQKGVTFLAPSTAAMPDTLLPDACPVASTWSADLPIIVAGDEMGYTPPVYEANDDGLIFPAGRGQLVLSDQWHGVASTINSLNVELYNLQLEQIIHDAVAQANRETFYLTHPFAHKPALELPYTLFYDIDIAVQSAVLNAMLEGTGLWYELALKPVTNGPFMSAYVVGGTPLVIEQSVDLSAPSEG